MGTRVNCSACQGTGGGGTSRSSVWASDLLENSHSYTGGVRPSWDGGTSDSCRVRGKARGVTVSLHSCGSLHKVVSQFHGICRAKRQLSGQSDDQDPHQGVLQNRNL